MVKSGPLFPESPNTVVPKRKSVLLSTPTKDRYKKCARTHETVKVGSLVHQRRHYIDVAVREVEAFRNEDYEKG